MCQAKIIIKTKFQAVFIEFNGWKHLHKLRKMQLIQKITIKTRLNNIFQIVMSKSSFFCQDGLLEGTAAPSPFSSYTENFKGYVEC